MRYTIYAKGFYCFPRETDPALSQPAGQGLLAGLESPRKGFHPPPVGFGGFWYTEAVFLYYERPPRLRERLIVVEYTT